MRTRAPRCGMTEPAAAWTGTPPTSSPPTSPEPPGSGHRLEQLCPAAASRCRRTEPSLPTIRPTFVGNAPRSQSEREPPICVAMASPLRCQKLAQNQQIWALIASSIRSCMMSEQIARQCSAQGSLRGAERDHYWRLVSIRRDEDPWQHPAAERLVQLLETLAYSALIRRGIVYQEKVNLLHEFYVRTPVPLGGAQLQDQPVVLEETS